MNTSSINTIKSGSLALLLAAIFGGCSPDNGRSGLGPKPVAAFSVAPIAGEVNKFLLTSTSEPDGFYYKWDIGDGGGGREGKKVDTAYYPEKGEYNIKLMVMGDGGISEAVQAVSVAEDDPNGCAGNKALLTGCDSKTWVLDQPGGGALWVGDPGGGKWWDNGAGDVALRTCQFDDEWTFKKDGSFTFENYGNMWIEDEGGAPWPTDIGLPVGCTDMSAVPAKYQAWGAGTFSFKIIGGNKLQVSGKGAHMGIYKVGEEGTTATPDEVINYDILEMTSTKMVVRKAYGWGQWKFTFKAK